MTCLIKVSKAVNKHIKPALPPNYTDSDKLSKYLKTQSLGVRLTQIYTTLDEKDVIDLEDLGGDPYPHDLLEKAEGLTLQGLIQEIFKRVC